MPLVRFEVRNEYRLGAPELYEGAKKYDCKDILDGVAVAGMVGILRQLGDLAELAAEVFQGLQEQVMATAARSHKMMVRVQQMEEALPPVEKAVLAQKSHVYFAYTAGFDWHANIQPKQNHLVHSDAPKFIMDSYEECRGPPCLELLDKFDTSGPGACLKRYSDPSFFKAALTRTDSVNAEKLEGERKAENAKKTGARQRNLEVPHVPTVYRGGRSSRMQFAPANSFGQNLTKENGSAFGMRSGSELGNGSSSFDSRTASENAECTFDASSSIQNKELEHQGLLTSRLKMQDCKAIDPVLPCEPAEGSHDIYSNRSLQEESINNSPSVTWVEKTEIVKPADQASENIMEGWCEPSETNSMHSDSNKLENGTSGHVNGGPHNIFGAHQNIHETLSYKNQFDEAGNESDSDITAEFGSDFNRQTKELADLQSANFENNGREGEKDIKNTISAKNLASSSIESNPPNKHTIQNFAKSVSLEDLHLQSPNSQDRFVVTDVHGSIDYLDNSAGKDVEPTISDVASSGSNIPSSPASLSDKIITSLNDSQQSGSQISGCTSSKFWTNGGLLGLEPSKPPDGVVLNSASENGIPGVKADEQCLSSETSMPKSHSDESRERVDELFKSQKSTEKSPGFEEGRERSYDHVGPNNLSPDQLTTRIGSMTFSANHSCSMLDNDKQDNYKDSSSTDRSSDAHGCGLVNTGIRKPGTELPTIPNVERPSNEDSQHLVGSPTGIFGNDRLYVNSSQRKIPLSRGESSEFVKNGLLKLQDSYSIQQKGSNRNLLQTSSQSNHSEKFEHESSTDFLSSSPPIRHMKISFNPVGGFETSKLKLKVTDELHFSDSTKDFVFPSFHLLPEPSIQLRDIDYESDDETIYGSSLYMSDELISHFSESSAEQWESDEAPGNQGSRVYDALHRVSSIQSISSSAEPEGITTGSVYADSDYISLETDYGLQTIHSGSILDLPSFDAVDSLKSLKHENNFINGNDQDFVLQHLNEPMPLPPPLPPLQWRVRKNQFNAMDNEQCVKSEALNNWRNLQGSAFATSHHMKLDPSVQASTTEAVKCLPKTEQDQQKFNVWREANKVINGKDTEEKEDLLHQIKTRSLNLRRTVTARPTQKPNPQGDIKVTAILEKANAIRQAFVGSDEEEDDN